MAQKEPRFPEYVWYCADCHECLNDQVGFDDNKFLWQCTKCSYKNSISKDNLRKPYAYLKNPTAKNKFVSFIMSVFRAIYGFASRTSLYCFLVFLIVLVTGQTSIEHLSLGLINPTYIEDYFCCLLICSGIVMLVSLVLFALAKRLFGRPNEKHHFIKETALFFRDNLLYPIKVIRSIFKKTTMVDTILSIVALVILILTIIVVIYGSLFLL